MKHRAKVSIEPYNRKSHKPFHVTRKSFAGLPTVRHPRMVGTL